MNLIASIYHVLDGTIKGINLMKNPKIKRLFF